ncbi:MAG: hypothetical protein GQ527_12880, partial [Bacteroidales bacterium]|nr:hypothetical protein [Bacteroidales bacterium]
DFRCRSERARGGSGFDVSDAGVYILDPNIEVSFMEKQDTIKRCHTYITTYFGDELADITYNYYSEYNCTNAVWNAEDTPLTLTIPTIHHYNDTLRNENYTYLEYFPFAYNNISTNSGSVPIFIYKVYRGFWNNMYSSYFVFRKNINGEYRKGWVKISVENITKIRLYEYAYEID